MGPFFFFLIQRCAALLRIREKNCFITCLHFGESFDTLDGLTISFSSANLQSRVRKGKMTEERYEKAMSLVTGVLDYDSFRNVDLVIEARFILIHAPMIIVFCPA
jgi:hypothetical protein